MIKLYGNAYSRANRVRWILEEIGLPYEEEETALGAKGTRSERFLGINPNGRIPVIDDSGLVLFESIPICLYLAKKYAYDAMYVDNIEEEGLVIQWAVWAMTELEQHIELASLHLTWFDADKRNPEIAEKEQAEVSRCLSMLEKEITKNGSLLEKRFTVADLIMCEVLTGVVHSKVDLSSFPNTKKYLLVNLSRPSAKQAFADEIIEPYLV